MPIIPAVRRALALLMLLAFVVPVAPAAPKTCDMGCAKTSACCCAKRQPEAAETRLTLPSYACCRTVGVPVAASAAAVLPAEPGRDLTSPEPHVATSTFALRARTTSQAFPPRAPPVPPVAI